MPEESRTECSQKKTFSTAQGLVVCGEGCVCLGKLPGISEVSTQSGQNSLHV